MGKIVANQQIFINYGPFSNRELLLFYGYFDPHNPYERVLLNFEVDDDDPLADKKLQLLKSHDLTLTDNFLKLEFIPERLMATLRICMLNEAEIQSNWNPWKIISQRNEEAALSYLENLISGLLENMERGNDFEEEEEGEESEEENGMEQNMDDDISEEEALAIAYHKSQIKFLNDVLEKISKMRIALWHQDS